MLHHAKVIQCVSMSGQVHPIVILHVLSFSVLAVSDSLTLCGIPQFPFLIARSRRQLIHALAQAASIDLEAVYEPIQYLRKPAQLRLGLN
jgi:hypothetical protein